MTNLPPDQPEQGQPYPPASGQYPPQGYQQSGNPKADAKAAKAYAKASRPWFKKKRFLLPLALLVLIVLSTLGKGGGGDSGNTASDTSSTDSSQAPSDTGVSDAAATPSSKPTKAAPKPAPKPVTAEAGAMIKEFTDNELSADAKYKDKNVKITGVVEKIDTALFDDNKYVLRLAGGGQFEILTVNCNDMSTDELSTLSKGDKVTVLGEFDDGGDLGVEVKNCSLA